MEQPSNLSGATVNDGESIGRRSKRSLIDRRRTGSKGSNKRGAQLGESTGEKVSRPQSLSAQQAAGSEKQTELKKPSLLRRLFCCAASDAGQPVETNEAAPNARKPNKLRAGRSPQPPPKDVKPDTSAAESSTANSKEPLDEKAGGATAMLINKEGASESKASTPGDGMMNHKTFEKQSEAAGGSPMRLGEQQQQPPQPPPLDTSATTLQQGHSQLHPPPTLSVTEATPVTSQHDNELISDRTPEQAQTDEEIEMRDSGPTVPITHNDVATSRDEISGSTQRDQAPRIPLPPPPPLEERQAATAPPVPSAPESSMGVVQPEPPKYLLPPIRPEMHGRKCLVLDLDETLVHSSFKVCSDCPQRGASLILSLDTSPCRFYHTS